MRRAALSILLLLAGCGHGPRAGDEVMLKKEAVLYLDERVYREAVELDAAGSRLSSPRQTLANSYLLPPGSRVRILGPADRGYKVVVEDQAESIYIQDGKGKIGWMISKYLLR